VSGNNVPAPARRDIVSIDDLTNEEVLGLFKAADGFHQRLSTSADTCPGSILATLFFEPSTRTRLSFESAMHRLGGDVIPVADPSTTSAAKGESLADTVRVVGGSYADILVLRHPDEGAALVAARYAKVPVVNAGDGAHEHPTQTLCDLYTLWKEKGELEGLDVVLCGDLRYSRTIHSFAYALARFRANIVTVPYPGFELPDYVVEKLKRDRGVETSKVEIGELASMAGRADAAYFTPHKPHQLSLFTKFSSNEVKKFDAIYMTRAQKERHGGESTDNYPKIDRSKLAGAKFKETRVMHPLPRVDEISYDLDQDPRAVYFRQAELGVPIRMALIAFLLGKLKLPRGFKVERPPSHRNPVGLRCGNARCVVNREAARYLVPEFQVRAASPLQVSCVFCDREAVVPVIGDSSTRRYGAPREMRDRDENLVYFASEEQAREAGYEHVG
jgi:aspartate carbamoyltransferase catalytic subunit